MTDEQLAILRAYSAGEGDTRDTIDALGMADYADLLIALARYDLPFPKPAETPQRTAHLRRAEALLRPLLANVP